MKNPPLTGSQKSSPTPSLRDKIDSVLGSPTMLAGDNEEQFSRLESAIIAHLKPQDVFEEIWTREIVELLFDIMRLRRWKVRLLEVNERNALDQYIWRNYSRPLGTDPLLSQWMKREPEAQKKIFDFISPVDRSYEHVEANTVIHNIDVLSSLDSMLLAIEKRKDGVIKELEFYRDRKAKRGAIEGAFKTVMGVEVADDQSQKG